MGAHSTNTNIKTALGAGPRQVIIAAMTAYRTNGLPCGALVFWLDLGLNQFKFTGTYKEIKIRFVKTNTVISRDNLLTSQQQEPSLQLTLRG